MKLRPFVTVGLTIWLLLLLMMPAAAAPRQLMRGHVPAVVAGLKPMGDLPGTNRLSLAIGLPLRNREALTNLLGQIYDPASPNYHRYLTPEQFTAQFGPTEMDYQKVIDFARQNRLTVVGTHSNRTLVDVSGKVADIERVFHVQMRTYQHPSEARQFFAPDVEPTLDASLPILSICGLNNYVLARPLYQNNSAQGKLIDHFATGTSPSGSYWGYDFRKAYAPGVTLTGSGQCVALFECDGYYSSDIASYLNATGLPSVALTNVLIDGFSGQPSGSGGEVEVALDIDMAISMAPGLSKIIVYEGPSDTPAHNLDLLNRIATDNLAKQISSSWLIDDTAQFAQIYQQFAVQGQSFFQASGDEGAYYPGIFQYEDSPLVTLVGGTTLTSTGTGGVWAAETVWSGSGGGISTVYNIPSWQTNINMTANQGSTTMRNIPDVALTANNIYIWGDGTPITDIGGTSCAAPLWAGFMALVNQQLALNGASPIGFVNPAIYTIGAATNYSSAFHDITTGNNTSSSSPTKFYAVAGYDLCTGWGTPAGQNLINALAPPVIVTLPPSATEGDGLLAGAGQIQLATAQTADVVIGLTSSDPAQVSVPASVTVFAGQSNAVFDLTILDDGVLDGTQTATITASVPGFGTGSASMTIFDKETATLQVSLSATVTKGQGAVQGTVQVSAPVAADVTVSLSSSSTNLIQVPASVIIPSGQTSAVFTASILTDGLINGGQTVNVTAHVQNWTDGTAAVAVQDNVNLTVTLPASAWENAGVLTNAGSISISGTLSSSLMVSLASGNPAKLTVPSSVTIPAGQVSNTFNITLVDNSIADGHQTVTVTASAAGFTNGSASMWVLDDESPPFPSNPQPGNLATNVSASTNLMWNNGNYSTNELILNGGFEAGSLTNWTVVPSAYGRFVINNGTVNPPSPDGPLPPFAGNFSALGDESGPGIFYMYQTISIPTSVTSATLRWAHRVRNFYTSFSSSQQFQVRICDTNNNVLATPFTTNPGDTLLGNWVQTNYDLTSFAGKIVRVMFWVDSGSSYLDVHVDSVSVQVNTLSVTNSSGIVTNDVYFGTNPTPGPQQFQGSTTNFSWPLPLLSPLTTYYWQIVAHRVGSATGAVWQFTTAGVDHFVWNTVSSPQYVNQPFGVTVTALDAFNTTVSNFTGRVGLSGRSGSSGLSELATFDDLSGSGLPVPAGYGGLTWSNFNYTIGSSHPNSGYSAGTVSPPNAAYNPYGNPASIISTGQVNFVSAYLTAAWNDNLQVQVKGYSGGTLVYSNSYILSATAPTLINFNYLGINEVDFISSGGTPHPGYSGSGTHFVMDNVVIGGSVATIASITPTNSGNFVNGAWTGNITVLQPATNVVLQADDGNQHTGSSNPFNVVLTNDISVSMVDSPDPVSVGANLTYTLAVTNTGPMAATGVMVTNILPASVAFVSVTSSQGTCAQNGGVIACNLGVVPGATNAIITIVVVPTIAGITLTNTATVSRGETDPYWGNNTATAVTTVTTPAISIADASVIEGNVGTTNMIFAVTLAAPSAQTITVNYATSDGTATAGSDYIATNGTVTFAPGITSATLAVAVVGDTVIETNETFFVNLSSPINGVLGRSRGVGTIINDDGLPGQVDHFTWSAIASPQHPNMPFGVTINALDASNNPVSNFTGTVSLYGTATNRVGANLDFEAGTLAPWTPLNVGNEPGPYDLVTFDVSGDGIPSTAFRIAANSGTPDGITQNVSLTGGTTYAVKMDIATDDTSSGNNADGGTTAILIGGTTVAQFGWGFVYVGNIYRTNLTGTFTPPSNGVYAVTLTFYRGYDEAGNLWCLADDLRIIGPGSSVTVLPAVTGNFTNGIWSGNVTVLDLATNAVLVADDGNGHTGLSNPFNVNMAPVILAQPTNQTVTVGGTATFSVSATGSLPLSYQWRFNGTNMVGETITTLTLTNVQVGQAGNYQVLVTNACGSVLSSNAVLTVTLDHFMWSPIPLTRFVNTPFSVVIQARDLTNGLFTNFTGTAILNTTNGITVTPPISGNFVQGVWTGSVTVSQTASNLVLRADDGLGHFGLANTINVISLPRLGMLRSGNIALYIWPVGYPGFVLETSGNLSPAAWMPVPYSPIPIGDQFVLPLDMTGTNGFYRLWFPGP